MTKKELRAMAEKLLEQADGMPDEDTETEEPTSDETPDSEPKMNESPDAPSEDEEPVVNENDEVEEEKQIEPQTNGKITDDVQPGPDVDFAQNTGALEVVGTEQATSENYDERFATIERQVTTIAATIDKLQVAMNEIGTRVELVQEVTDKVVTTDHDELLTQSIKLLV